VNVLDAARAFLAALDRKRDLFPGVRAGAEGPRAIHSAQCAKRHRSKAECVCGALEQQRELDMALAALREAAR